MERKRPACIYRLKSGVKALAFNQLEWNTNAFSRRALHRQAGTLALRSFGSILENKFYAELKLSAFLRCVLITRTEIGQCAD